MGLGGTSEQAYHVTVLVGGITVKPVLWDARLKTERRAPHMCMHTAAVPRSEYGM